MPEERDDDVDDAEAAKRRFDETIKRMLATPPQLRPQARKPRGGHVVTGRK